MILDFPGAVARATLEVITAVSYLVMGWLVVIAAPPVAAAIGGK